MSRYTTNLPDGGEIVVGWDRPLNSYFAQMFDANGICRLDIGALPDDTISSVGDLEKRLGKLATRIEERAWTALRAER